jgi:hypothetical protein
VGGGASGGGTGASEGGVVCSNPATWYKDADGDGYGTTSESIVSCSSPAPTGWTTKGGDCMDDKAEVHPNQPPGTYFDQPYSIGNGKDSFDWDCSGTEDGDPTQKVAGKCGFFTTCDASSGYVASARTGTGLNAYCGSQSYSTCSGIATLCTASTKDLGTGSAYRCR